MAEHDRDDIPVYVISVAAELAGMHPQTLRAYDRLGLVSPGRASGRGRRYSAREVALLRQVQKLSQVDGINLAGVKRIIELENQVDALDARVAELRAALAEARADAIHREAAARDQAEKRYRRDLVKIDRGAVVVWRPGGPRR